MHLLTARIQALVTRPDLGGMLPVAIWAEVISSLQPLATSVTLTIAAGATPTFGLFAQGTGNVPFNPGANRAFLRFKQGTLSVGATSAALRTQ